jgi:methionyl aminopeptidase
VTRDALDMGIREAKIGNRVGHISSAIQRHAESHGFSIVRTLVGHGVGRHLHEEPAVPNFGRPGDGPALEPGMVLAIEPMVNIGARDVRTLSDGWTIVTSDGSLSAHFEHSVAVTENGPEILSVPPAESRRAEGRG